MKKNPLPKPIILLILTLLTSVLWVGLSIYRTVTIKPPVAVSENISKPLNSTLNTGVIQKIESAIFFEDSQIPPLNINVNPNPTTLPTSIPEVTPEASPSGSPQSQI